MPGDFEVSSRRLTGAEPGNPEPTAAATSTQSQTLPLLAEPGLSAYSDLRATRDGKTFDGNLLAPTTGGAHGSRAQVNLSERTTSVFQAVEHDASSNQNPALTRDEEQLHRCRVSVATYHYWLEHVGAESSPSWLDAQAPWRPEAIIRFAVIRDNCKSKR